MDEIFNRYNSLWKAGKISHPLVVLIGGHIGTGKSTFTKLLEQHITNICSVPTGVIRSIQQANSTKEDNPILFNHSFDLYKLISDRALSNKERAIIGFQHQSEMIQGAISNIIHFSKSEGQQYIIEGNHILPSFIFENINKKNIIYLFFKTTDIAAYKRLVSGPTHRRSLTNDQFNITRDIHDYIVDEAQRFHLPLFEYDQQEKALKYVSEKLQEIIPNENS